MPAAVEPATDISVSSVAESDAVPTTLVVYSAPVVRMAAAKNAWPLPEVDDDEWFIKAAREQADRVAKAEHAARQRGADLAEAAYELKRRAERFVLRTRLSG